MAEINDYLKDLGKQEVQEESKILLVNNPILEAICDKFERYLKNAFLRPYDTALDSVKDLKYTAKDVKDFSVVFKKYESRAGFDGASIFFSALINHSEENDFEIFFKHLSKRLNSVGYRNKKNVRVIGDVGMFPGSHMSGGQLIIEGNAGHIVGSDFHNGILIIKGNVEGVLAMYTGSCSKSCFKGKNGGEIHVEGKADILKVAEDFKGKIYYKKELVWPKK